MRHYFGKLLNHLRVQVATGRHAKQKLQLKHCHIAGIEYCSSKWRICLLRTFLICSGQLQKWNSKCVQWAISDFRMEDFNEENAEKCIIKKNFNSSTKCISSSSRCWRKLRWRNTPGMQNIVPTYAVRNGIWRNPHCILGRVRRCQ